MTNCYVCIQGKKFFLEEDTPISCVSGGKLPQCFGCPRLIQTSNEFLHCTPLLLCLVKLIDG